MADSIKNMSPNIIMPEQASERLLRLDREEALPLNRSGVMHAGLTKVGKGYKVARYNVCKHQVVFVISGKLYYQDIADKVCIAKAGERIFMPISYQQHYWTKGDLELCWFHLHSIGLWERLDSEVISACESKWWRELYRNVLGFLEESGSSYQDSIEVAGHYAGLICKYLEREINGVGIKERVTEQQRELEYLMCKIEQDLARRWTVKEMAEFIFVSTAQLHRMVQTTYRATPMQLVREMRLAKARELLYNTEMSLGMISSEVGYESAFALSKAFKKHYNVTPADIRRNCGL